MTRPSPSITQALLFIAPVCLLVACGGGKDPRPMDPDGGMDPNPCVLDPGLPECSSEPCEADPTRPECQPEDPCDPTPCALPRQRCVREDEGHRCECEPGTHFEGGACVDDTSCEAGSCNEHGRCEEDTGRIACACDTGYLGDFCERCDESAGYLPDGAGGCDDDLCDPNPCTDPERSLCSVVAGRATCACNAGTHDSEDGCVPDATCTPTTCAGHGSCAESGGAVACDCDTGWTGAYCDRCDAGEGYHADGAGGCTRDRCLPNPCVAALETVCIADAEGVRCECDSGAHRDGEECVGDEVCEDATCGGHGDCSVTGGRAFCSCDIGWTGTDCSGCDTEAGYHDDGMGDCMTDLCLPNPCGEANQTVCTDDGGRTVCGCDPGFHEDGVGGCTDDPCTPDPCSALDQACRTASDGTAECYTPTCDDDNPCTNDIFRGGRCEFESVVDGTGCSTTLCIREETCVRGECGGGSAITCDDENPCTRDRCDDLAGCQNVEDDGLIPSDGIACTVDECEGGVARHWEADERCDDGLFCTGVETCEPASGSADGFGCVTRDVPTPPGNPTPCRYFEACREGTMSFPEVVISAGTSCDDGLACTSGDVCVSDGGACAGTVIPGCPGGGCDTTTPWSAVIDIPRSTVSGEITLGGGPLPDTILARHDETVSLYAVSHDTGTRHELGHINYNFATGGHYPIGAGDRTYDASLVPGIYDVLYRRDVRYTSTFSERWVDDTDSENPFPNGDRLLGMCVAVP